MDGNSAYIDFIDPRLFQIKNRSRNWRFFFVCNLISDNFTGAIAYRYIGAELSLMLSAICRLVITLALFEH